MFDVVKVTSRLTPAGIEEGYRKGMFPMGREGETAVSWHSPDPRAVIRLDAFHVPRSLGRTLRRGRFQMTVDRAFEQVMAGCAARPDVWLTPALQRVYLELHRRGKAHSLEVWMEEALAGGIYGVHLGGAFFGESMFHRRRDMSKVALVILLERLKQRGFALFDVQYWTPHLGQFGAIEIPAAEYRARLNRALALECRFD